MNISPAFPTEGGAFCILRLHAVFFCFCLHLRPFAIIMEERYLRVRVFRVPFWCKKYGNKEEGNNGRSNPNELYLERH